VDLNGHHSDYFVYGVYGRQVSTVAALLPPFMLCCFVTPFYVVFSCLEGLGRTSEKLPA